MSRRNDLRVPWMALLAVLILGILVSVPAAGAQSAADQYVPQLDRAGSSRPAATPGESPPAPAAQAPDERAATLAAQEVSAEGESGGGSAPGGGFPLTPFVAGIAALLVLALLGRALHRGIQRATSGA